MENIRRCWNFPRPLISVYISTCLLSWPETLGLSTLHRLLPQPAAFNYKILSHLHLPGQNSTRRSWHVAQALLRPYLEMTPLPAVLLYCSSSFGHLVGCLFATSAAVTTTTTEKAKKRKFFRPATKTTILAKLDNFMPMVTQAASPRLIQDFETLALYKGHFPKQDWLKIGVWTPKQTPPGYKFKS